jgi:uncharacterized coiled-coil protein SlyX
MNIYFINPQVSKYIFANKIWSIQIEDFSVRILPGGINNDIYKERTDFFYIITGLPLNTNVLDLKLLIDYLKGKTCTFGRTYRSSVTKTAYIYVEKENFINDYKNFTIVNERKRYQRLYINKSRPTITINNEIIDKFNHISLFNSKRGPNSKTFNNKNNNSYRNNNTIRNNHVTSPNAYDKQKEITSLQTNKIINNLQERLLKTEKLIESLNNRVTEQEQIINKQNSNITELQEKIKSYDDTNLQTSQHLNTITKQK